MSEVFSEADDVPLPDQGSTAWYPVNGTAVRFFTMAACGKFQ
ncbi:hypothetical protein [Paenibacillus tritici]|nr:hypothetical protein [Paenibacillus tritici]